MSSKHFQPPVPSDRRYLVLQFPRQIRFPKGFIKWALIIGLIAGSNLLTLWWLKPGSAAGSSIIPSFSWSREAPLYLLDKVPPTVNNPHDFEEMVRQVSQNLDIAPEWLMSVMYAESRLDPSIVNRRGSQASGLIQFMPATAREMGTTVTALRQMPAVQQLIYVERYLAQVKSRYGPYQSLTDLYLAILYPKARGQDYCYTLYATPTTAYEQNKGLDQDIDGRVSVSDVDQYLKRMFPTAYAATKGEVER